MSLESSGTEFLGFIPMGNTFPLFQARMERRSVKTEFISLI